MDPSGTLSTVLVCDSNPHSKASPPPAAPHRGPPRQREDCRYPLQSETEDLESVPVCTESRGLEKVKVGKICSFGGINSAAL